MATKQFSPAQLAAQAKFAAMVRAKAAKRKRNPVGRASKADAATREYGVNPLTRVKVNSPAQRSGAAPSKRLKARRKATAKAPAGYYANPLDDMGNQYGHTDKATPALLRSILGKLIKEIGAPEWWGSNDRPNPGAIGFDKAYGGYTLVQVAKSGGENSLSSRLSAGEMRHFLDGALLVARAMKKD
jgi:hypothetical protein